MKAIVTLVKKTDLEELIERNNADEIKSMIADKERELEEAEDKAQWYYDIGLDEWSDNEMAKQRKLIRDIEKLKAAFEIKSMIADKERELEEAEDKAQWYYDIGLDEWSDNEMARQRKLIRDIEKLKAALQA